MSWTPSYGVSSERSASSQTSGITRFVIAADHGHLFAESKDDDMKIDAPGGDTLVLHRRCWAGRGGSTPDWYGPDSRRRTWATTRTWISSFLRGTGVFKSGGGLSYHHGGVSLQEVVVPVLQDQNAEASPLVGQQPKSISWTCPPRLPLRARSV